MGNEGPARREPGVYDERLVRPHFPIRSNAPCSYPFFSSVGFGRDHAPPPEDLDERAEVVKQIQREHQVSDVMKGKERTRWIVCVFSFR